ncbi:acetoacetate decarboxylase family protein [Halomicrobium katesii]|uniref:acetoacetate decarboxylase family protein n=1 Tax=Halomicrobium katesii TaxID=437163 RepID=UPI0003666AF1|nr:acetoacetate decarboxylase family protein [Halomicrobium katesii]
MNLDATEPTETVTLSTGHAVEVPLPLSARITGAVFSAPLGQITALLPDRLRPLRVTPRRGGVTILSVSYDRIGEDVMAPYDEVSVQIPAVERSARTVPVLTGQARTTSGFVWAMPVTTEASVALGREVWGYPKRVADIEIDAGASQTDTTVDIDGQRLLDLSVERPPQVPFGLSGYTYTERDGTLLREATAIRGRVGGWLYSEAATLELGEHPLAERLAAVDLGTTAVQRLAADCQFTISPPRHLADE